MNLPEQVYSQVKMGHVVSGRRQMRIQVTRGAAKRKVIASSHTQSGSIVMTQAVINQKNGISIILFYSHQPVCLEAILKWSITFISYVPPI